MPRLDVLVVGATGRQGGAVAHALLQGGHNVRALTRNLAHPAADALRLRGARLAWADLDDEARLLDAARGVDAIFAVTAPAPKDPAAETRHGLQLAEVARRAGVAHFVYSSAMGADTLTSVPEYDRKHEIERYLAATRVPHTVVAPGFFMENILAEPWLTPLRRGELALPLPSNCRLQQTARADFGRFVRIVMEQPEKFLDQRICIASDELSPIEMTASLARTSGQRIQHVPMEPDALDPALAARFAWIAEHEGAADVPGLRRSFPQVNWHTLDGWAKRQNWPQILQQKPAAPPG